MPTYRQRGTAWRVEVCVNGVRDGATFDTKTQAKAWAAQRETALRNKAAGQLPDYTLAQTITRYLEEVSPKKKSHGYEVRILSAFCRNYPKMIRIPIAELTTDDFGKWRDDRLKTVANASVRRELSVFSAIMAVARKEWKWIRISPLADLKKPIPPKHRDRRISDDEIEKLMLAFGFNEQQPENFTQQIAVAFLLAIETAMRAGEIKGLQWKRVNLDKQYVTLEMTKNGTSRDVPLSKRAVELLRLMKGIGKDKVFTVQSNSFDTLFRKVRNRCGIDDLHFHDARHEACTRLASKLQVLELARMIGHKDLRSLMIYYNATATELAARLD